MSGFRSAVSLQITAQTVPLHLCLACGGPSRRAVTHLSASGTSSPGCLKRGAADPRAP